MQGNNSMSASITRQLQGESKVVRAFWYFYLTNMYGDVPLVTSTDYTINAGIARSPKVTIYQQIISDLTDAKSMMATNFIDATDTTVTTDRTRPNKWAASALLARTYLYTGNYQDAKTESDSLIGNPLFSLLNDLGSVFKANSMEAIWQIGIPLPTNYNTPDALQFILLTTPGNNGSCCAISPQLLNSFEPGDSRRSIWIDSLQTTAPLTNYYYPFKYQVQSGTDVTEYVMALRLAEQYLIRAEAEANGAGNGINAAVSDLNVIRNRAGLSNYAGLTDKTSVLNALLHERQVELFTEWGHRWFDIIRTNSADTIMGAPGNVCQFKGGSWNPDGHQQLFPIPQSEILRDVNLTQNSGY
jgi:starch-binding outer membrane protein, SusD/RagB family